MPLYLFFLFLLLLVVLFDSKANIAIEVQSIRRRHQHIDYFQIFFGFIFLFRLAALMLGMLLSAWISGGEATERGISCEINNLCVCILFFWILLDFVRMFIDMRGCVRFALCSMLFGGMAEKTSRLPAAYGVFLIDFLTLSIEIRYFFYKR